MKTFEHTVLSRFDQVIDAQKYGWELVAVIYMGSNTKEYYMKKEVIS